MNEDYVVLSEKEQKISPSRRKRSGVLVISGPTAVGKSAVSCAVGEAVGGEIISADSVQVYKHVNIGSSKVDLDMRRLVPHHLIDVCDLDGEFTVCDFYFLASDALRDISSRGRVPIVVGGSGFYVSTLIHGLPNTPAPDWALRKKLSQDIAKYGLGYLYNKLVEIDPKYAASLSRGDRHKIIRALDIMLQIGGGISDLPPRQNPLLSDFEFVCWFLYCPRDFLYERIDIRCEYMLRNGLVREVEKLKGMGIESNHSLARSIGYKECLNYLNSNRDESDYQHFVSSFKQNTKRYAKRQLTWFRKEKEFSWLNVARMSSEEASEILLRDFQEKY